MFVCMCPSLNEVQFPFVCFFLNQIQEFQKGQSSRNNGKFGPYALSVELFVILFNPMLNKSNSLSKFKKYLILLDPRRTTPNKMVTKILESMG